MAKAYLLLGGNVGDRFKIINQSIILIEERIGIVIQQSSKYETVPWGFDTNNLFLNQAITIETNYTANEVLEKIHQIEAELGRVRIGEQYASRTVDIDIIFYENLIITQRDLIIPHIHLYKRRFVLEPLNELCPDYIHPVLNKPVRQLHEECNDPLQVMKI